MNITYKWSDTDIAIKARLFVPGWQLRWILKGTSKCLIAYDNNTPIGVLGWTDDYNPKYPEVQIFVRKSYRNNGIATAMLLKFKKKFKPTTISAAEGVLGSRWFWRKHGIKCQNKRTWSYHD